MPHAETGFERLKSYYDAEERVCPTCGYAEDDAEWDVIAERGGVRYERACPSCGVVHSHVINRG